MAYARWWRAGTIRREGDTEFAKRLRVSAPAVSQWRERVEPLDVERCEAIAQLCEVPFDWLLRGERTAGPVPELFSRFLPVYRDWVRRGGLKKKPAQKKTERGREVATTGAAALALAVKQTADLSEIERKDIPAKLPKRKGA